MYAAERLNHSVGLTDTEMSKFWRLTSRSEETSTEPGMKELIVLALLDVFLAAQHGLAETKSS